MPAKENIMMGTRFRSMIPLFCFSVFSINSKLWQCIRMQNLYAQGDSQNGSLTPCSDRPVLATQAAI